MGLLDSDAEELKKNATDSGKSGRRVNQSGLGAFKGLSKYSNLTAKYRQGAGSVETKSTQPVQTEETVEQSRGTISKSVQTQGEEGASSSYLPSNLMPLEEIIDENRVGANQGQSQCETKAFSEDIELSAKSVLENASGFAQSSLSDDKLQSDPIVFSGQDHRSESFDKSVQTQCKNDVKTVLGRDESFKLSAKSVPANDLNQILDNKNELLMDEKTIQCEVSAMVEKTAPVNKLLDSAIKNSDLSAISVRSPSKVSAPKRKINEPSVNINAKTKSVQTQSDVSAKWVRREVSERFNSEVPQDFSNLISQANSKCIPKNLAEILPTESVTSLSGSQRRIVEFLFQLCVWNNSLITPPLTKQQLVSETGLSEETAISSVKRLRNKYIIDRHAYKDGKAGWTQYRFSEASYRELAHMQQLGARSSAIAPLMSGSVPRQTSSPPTFTVPQATHEATWFKELDFSKVRPIGPMAVNGSIRVLVQQRLTPEHVQEFINRFTSWMATQAKISSPLGLFCDKLKEFAKEGDSPVLACLTDEEREAEAMFVKSIEKARVEINEIAMAKDAISKQEKQESLDLEFEKWVSSISPEDLKALVPGNPIAPFGSHLHSALVRAHFEQKFLKEQVEPIGI